jgi:hypothetical protein
MNDIGFFLMTFGIMLYPMVLLAVVVLALTAVAACRLAAGRADETVRSGIDAILFWGVVAALLGFLGQWVGLFKIARILIEEAPRVGLNPQAVGVGFAESLRTSIFGVSVLVLAGVAWFVLYSRWRRVTGKSWLSRGEPSADGT